MRVLPISVPVYDPKDINPDDPLDPGVKVVIMQMVRIQVIEFLENDTKLALAIEKEAVEVPESAAQYRSQVVFLDHEGKEVTSAV